MKCKVLESGICEVTQEYKGLQHGGIDVVNQNYTLGNIVAHTEGEVVEVRNNCTGFEPNGSYGNYVKIKHDGYYTLYAHMVCGSIKVSVGQRVSKGQLLGYMGATGTAYGSHLHFEVRNESDVRIDPTSYLDNELPSVAKDCTGVIIYQAFTKEWLPEVSKCDYTSEGYAGLNNEVISGFRCKPQFGEIIYKAHIKNGEWLEEVSSNNYSKNDGSSYAGLYGNPIDMIKIKSTKGWVKYRVKTIEDGWLGWIHSDNYNNTDENSYAGIPNHTIIAIQMY